MDAKQALTALSIMSKMMPEEVQIELLEEALTSYKIVKSKETKGQLVSAMHLLTNTFLTEDLTIEQTLQKINLHDSKMKLGTLGDN